jgi:hypothetical protein
MTWMASDPDPTEAIREDVRKMKELCEKWEDAHPSSYPVQPAPSSDGESTDTSTPRPDVNEAHRRKPLAQLDRRQILDTETVRIIRVESKYAEYLIVDSRGIRLWRRSSGKKQASGGLARAKRSGMLWSLCGC